MTTIGAARLFDGETFREHAAVEVAAGGITAVHAGRGEHALPPGWLLVPGFVDLQVNGAGGVLFNAQPEADAIAAIAATLARLGTTALLPTLISDRDLMPAALHAAQAAIAAGVAGPLGVHIEGPFINPARRGIHPARNVVALREDDIAVLAAPRPGVRLLTLAPERADSGQMRQLAAAGVVLFAGHSDATCEQAAGALDAGVTGFTHLFNAMSQFGSRAPGCVGAAMAHGRACASIICDGVHVHPASVRAAYLAMGPARLFFVSDCMPTVGAASPAFVWDGQTVTLRDGRLQDAQGTLAGAHVTMAECVARAVTLCGIPLADALRMATATPARHAGAVAVGRIAPGCRADMVALDDTLAVRAVWQGGARLL